VPLLTALQTEAAGGELVGADIDRSMTGLPAPTVRSALPTQPDSS
jgi:hypothetical protein